MSKKPHTVLLLDESGSMSMVRDTVITTFNEYTNSIKDVAKTVSLYTFDSEGVREVMHKIPAKEVPELTDKDYHPNAMTPLYDSIAYVINKFKRSKRPVQIVIHTDGSENYSREYNNISIKHLIDEKIKDGWLFVYLGEGLDAQNAMKSFNGVKVNFKDNASRSMSMNAVANTTALYSQTSSVDTSTYSKNVDGTIDIEKGDKVL
jgi:hypothetical protein